MSSVNAIVSWCADLARLIRTYQKGAERHDQGAEQFGSGSTCRTVSAVLVKISVRNPRIATPFAL